MSDVEKRSASGDSSQNANHVETLDGLPPDPDANLSLEERDRIVSIIALI